MSLDEPGVAKLSGRLSGPFVITKGGSLGFDWVGTLHIQDTDGRVLDVYRSWEQEPNRFERHPRYATEQAVSDDDGALVLDGGAARCPLYGGDAPGFFEFRDKIMTNNKPGCQIYRRDNVALETETWRAILVIVPNCS